MQIYSTLLPITDLLTTDNLIDLVIEWNQRSPYNKINNIDWDGKNKNIKFEDGNRSLSIEEIRTYNIIAIRFHMLDENNIIWTTDIVVDFSRRLFSIKLDRETTVETKIFIPSFKPPVIVNMLLEKGYVEYDSDIEISTRAIVIDKSNYKIVEDVICRNKTYMMPVIYVTKTWGKYPFKVNELAYRLRGVAHVLIEEDASITNILREKCEGKNAHHGSIGIYYPSRSASHKIVTTGKYEGREKLLIDKIVTIVCRYVNQQARDKMLTWEGVQNELLKLRYASATEKRTLAENEVDEVYNNFNTELEEKEKVIEEQNNRIMALQAENQGLHAKLDTLDEVPLLFYGLEEEVYEGEIRDHILEMLKEHIKHISSNSRKEHIILDILENNEMSDRLDIQRDNIKRMLKGYTKLNDSLKRELRDFGFEISKDGGHYKLVYNGDPRYLFTISSSGSDSQHGGGNLSSQIINKIL